MIKIYNTTKNSFVNTYEAYSRPIYIGNNNVVIPYINIDLMPHNPITVKQSVIDYSYYVFNEVSSMFFNANKGKMKIDFTITSKGEEVTEYIMAGGFDSSNVAEITILCKELIFCLPEESKFSDTRNPFIPFDTPKYKQNLDIDLVNTFFSRENLPKEIINFLGANPYCLLWQ